MSEATCAVLSAIFPLILLSAVVERRGAHRRIRRHKLTRSVTRATFTAAIGGTVYSVIGVETGGYPLAAGLVMWAFFAFAVFGLGYTLLAALATQELKEDAD